jgi:hypothetical protein
MVFPKLPDVGDAKAQILPFLAHPTSYGPSLGPSGLQGGTWVLLLAVRGTRPADAALVVS